MAFFVKGEKIFLRKDATWIADGVEITHDKTRDLFFKSIHWDSTQKQYYLEVGYERIFIEVEDTPYFVVSIERQTPGPVLAKLSNFTDTPIETVAYANEALYLTLSSGQKARFLSAAYYDLLRDLQEDPKYYFLELAGKRINLALKHR